MLVLRRRSQEVIVFEGGLTLTLVELADHKAWLGFQSPQIEKTITIAPLSVGEETMTIGVRSPSSISHANGATRVVLDEHRDHSAVLVLEKSIGETISFDGMDVAVAWLANGRAGLGIRVECLSELVTVSVQSVSGLEARIGIEAPDDLRVMRKELWVEMLDANTNASQWTDREMDSLRAPERQPN